MPREDKGSTLPPEVKVLIDKLIDAETRRKEVLSAARSEWVSRSAEVMMTKFQTMFTSEQLEMKLVDFFKKTITEVTPAREDELMDHCEVPQSGFSDENMAELQAGDAVAVMKSPAETKQTFEVSNTREAHHKSQPESITRSLMPDNRFRTPLGRTVQLPKVLKTKVDGTEKLDFRRPRIDEEVAISLNGSPMVLSVNKLAGAQQIQKLLDADEAVMSPETRQVVKNMKALMEKKLKRAGDVRNRIDDDSEALEVENERQSAV
ncbi:unnamed protein product [Caenorhabditis auriculariae]|uniref:Uncharacterized protein n=1 Tax=Caenorhabditis auriculariae TaxID=2777116 RepID=A0A8S1H728_9PELO|nr:unnamed protein product [Caenorhabditis auriculariae]